MAIDPKVQYDESDSGSDSKDEEPSKEELMELLQESHPLVNKKRERERERERGIQGVTQEKQNS